MYTFKQFVIRTSRCTIQRTLIIFSSVLFCAVCIAFLLPLLAAVFPLFRNNTAPSELAALSVAVRFTVLQALLSAFFASILGLCTAFFCACREFYGRKFLMALSAIPLSMPPVVIALAFILFFGKNGVLNQLLATLFAGTVSVKTFLYSLWGILLVHTFYNFPIAMRTVSTAWEKIPKELEQAAQLLGASRFRIFCTVIFPSLCAPLFASFVIIFLYCFFSFVIILLLGGLGITTLEVELYQAIRRDVYSISAAWIVLIETAFACVAIIIYLGLRSRIPDHKESTQGIHSRTSIMSGEERLVFIVIISLIFCCLLLPLGSLFVYSLTTPRTGSLSVHIWVQLFNKRAFWIALGQTIQIGSGTACLSVITALFFAYQIYDSGKTWQIILPFIPFTVSSTVLGSGWLKLPIVSSSFLLIIAQTALAWPFAWMQIETSLAKIPQTAIHAAHIFSVSRCDGFFRVIIPLCKTGIVSAFCCVFAISAGDAALPLILHIPNFENLALLLFRFAGAYRFAESAAIALILALLTGFLFYVQDSLQSARGLSA